MSNAIVADTQSVVWYLFVPQNLTFAAATAMQTTVTAGYPICVASISLVEVTYLVEKGKLRGDALIVMRKELLALNSDFELVPLDFDVAKALEHIPRGIVPDMPDRIIAATALHLNLPLVTSDHKIQAATQIQTVW